MRRFSFHILVFSIPLFLNFCQPTKEKKLDSKSLHQWNIALEKSIVNDFFSPPVAGRIYAYANLAAIMTIDNEDIPSFFKELKQELNLPKAADEISLQIASISAFYHTSIGLTYSIENLESEMVQFKKELEYEGWSNEDIELAIYHGKLVADIILDWARHDKYIEMRSFDEYKPIDEAGKWKPTPPDYRAALEPYWSNIRPFVLDSTSQFKPEPPTKYNLDTNSQFFKETIEVYEALKNNTKETEAIGKFWDCNPLVVKYQGHVTFAEKKLTPGGHWMNIARIAMKKNELSFEETIKVYAILAIGIHDAFISCWDEKYRSNYVRPVTVIQEFIDPNWKPILYTPNFPEYPSGHSVVSASAATILTHFFGEDFAFIDSTEVPYGMPPRSFSSFYEASEEAAISRLYGGIHFRPAIENGKKQGREIGKHLLQKMNLN